MKTETEIKRELAICEEQYSRSQREIIKILVKEKIETLKWVIEDDN